MGAVSEREETLLSVINELASTLTDVTGITEAQATQVATLISREVQERFGGEEIYIHARSREERDRRICEEFTGSNWRDLCERFGIKRRRLYQIVERAR